MIASHHSGFIDMAGFSERLKQLRQERKITQTRLAELLDVQPRVYNRWERGDAVPHLDTVVRIAEVLGVTIDELVGRQDGNGQPIVRNPELLRLYRELDTLPMKISRPPWYCSTHWSSAHRSTAWSANGDGP